jgi:PAS domain S-box-containing protein
MKTAFVGGGQGCLAVLELNERGQLGALDLDILAVVDIDVNAPGMLFAKKKGWLTLNSIEEAVAVPDLQLVIELTGSDEILDQIYMAIPPGVRVMDHVMARVFWDLEKLAMVQREQLQLKAELEAKLASDHLRLQERNRTFRQIVDAVHGIITIKDLDGRFQLVNPRAERLFGIAQEEMLGRTVGDLLPPEVADAIEAHDATALEKGGHETSEERIRIDGTYHYLVSERFPLFDYTGEVTALCCVARDVTRDRQLRDEMVVTERLAAVGKLSAGVAHELNNPLTGILTFAEDLFLEAGDEDPKRQDYEVIVNEALRCRNIVRDLLDFSRQKASERQRMSINYVVQRVIAMVERQATFHNIRLDVALVKDMPEVNIDPGQIQQAILNLVINARDAMNGSGVITIRSTTADESRWVTVSVQDTGCGIAAPCVEKIFEPFYSTKGDQGNGLGLPAVQSLAEQHGGRVEVESEVGVGSTFSLLLPAVHDAEWGDP